MDSYSFFITICLIITAGLCIHDLIVDKKKENKKSQQGTDYDHIF